MKLFAWIKKHKYTVITFAIMLFAFPVGYGIDTKFGFAQLCISGLGFIFASSLEDA